MRRTLSGRAFLVLFAAAAFVSPLPGQVVETKPGSPPTNEKTSGEGALIFSPAAVPLPADLTPSGNGLITGQFGPNQAPFEFAIHLTIRGAYDDNIALTHTNELDDFFVEIQPCLLLGIGDLVRQDTFLAAIYIPSFYRYEDNPIFDSNQHVIHVLGGITTGKLTLRMSQDIALRDNIVLAASTGERSGLGTTNGRTDLHTFNTRLSANYNMTPNDFMFSELKMNRTEYAAPLISNELYAADLYLNHGFSSQFVLGAGVELGSNPVDFPTPDQRIVQANAHLNYTPSDKFSLDVIAGEEFRTFQNGARGTYDTPVFAVSANWAPEEETKIGLTASRQIYNSAAATAQDYVDTSVSGILREHICKPFYVTLLGGYEHVEYFNAIDSPMPLTAITSDYFYMQPSFDLVVTRWWEIGAYYLRRQNAGSVSTLAFQSNEFGFRTTIKF
ncbi:MAG TPA: hypothetical protein VFA58_02605 [Chthoniobacterales bacterium]|nr:hypothetical protein [Chthoniobacterales bacterium]